MKIKMICLFIIISVVGAYFLVFNQKTSEVKNLPQKDLILTSFPSHNNEYYQPFRQSLLDFNHALYRSKGLDEETLVLSKEPLDQPTEEYNYDDIWVRDVAPVVTTRLVKFKYSPKYLRKGDSSQLDQDFRAWLDRHNFDYANSNLILDGGNFAWDKNQTAIITDRVLSDNNNLSKEEVIEELKKELQLDKIIIIPTETGDVLSHADGMVKFMDKDTLMISDFLGDDDFRQQVEKIIKKELPTIKIVKQVSSYVSKGQYDEDIASAKGLYINMLETADTLYVPQFNLPTDKEQLDFVKQYTTKQVIPIDVEKLSTMGGAVNCLTWYCPKELLPVN